MEHVFGTCFWTPFLHLFDFFEKSGSWVVLPVFSDLRFPVISIARQGTVRSCVELLLYVSTKLRATRLRAVV